MPCDFLLPATRNHVSSSVKYGDTINVQFRLALIALRSLSALPGSNVLLRIRSAVNSSAGGTSSTRSVAGITYCPLSTFVWVCQSISAFVSDVTDRSAEALSVFRAVPPPFSTCAVLNSDTPSGDSSVVNPLFRTLCAFFSSTTRAENIIQRACCANWSYWSSSSAVSLTSNEKPYSTCGKSFVHPVLISSVVYGAPSPFSGTSPMPVTVITRSNFLSDFCTLKNCVQMRGSSFWASNKSV